MCNKKMLSTGACCSSLVSKSDSVLPSRLDNDFPDSLDARSTLEETGSPITETYCSSMSSSKLNSAQSSVHKSSCPDCQLDSDHVWPMSSVIDLEKGPTMSHVVIQVAGMTCTGCERKLSNVLSGISGVRNIKTSIILGRAEFDLEIGVSVDEAISILERQTEFKCVIQQEGVQLEVLLPIRLFANATTIITRTSGKDLALLRHALSGFSYPRGVQNVQIIDDKNQVWKFGTVNNGFRKCWGLRPSHKFQQCRARITFDPLVIGARDLLEKEFGTPLVLAPPKVDCATISEISHLYKTLYMTLLSLILTVPVLVMSWAPLPRQHTIAYRSSSLVLATLVQLAIAGPFYSKALKALLFSRIIEMDLLIVISTTTAYVYSVVAFIYETVGRPLSTGGFFQTSTLLVTLIMFGRLASAYARHRAAMSISLHSLQPSKAVIMDGIRERVVDIREIQYHDLFKILPDSIVPTDGIIVSGESEIDESMISGEAIPVPKFPGSRIIAGSMNGPSPVLARLTRLPNENSISMIASMVDEAKLSKPRIQDVADRVASLFVPTILGLSVLVFSIWVAVGMALRSSSTSESIVTAITYALAASIVSCPCGIGLAVPMVMVIAGGVGAKHGVIVKSLSAVENATNASHVVFDKTGTLTNGKFSLVEEVYREENRAFAAAVARGLTSSSKHPVSKALTAHCESLDISPVKLEGISSIVGKGMRASLEGQQVRGGSPLFTEAIEDFDVQRLLSLGMTVFCLRYGSALLAIYGLRDTLRTDTSSVIYALQSRNIPVSIVSGDSSSTVRQLATEFKIPSTHAKGQCSPEDKARYIASLSTAPPNKKGKQPAPTIIFCGDGSNDAVALAQASIGIHMTGGTDLAKNAADVVLTHPSLAGVLALMDLSKAAMRRVHLNFAWSFIYNIFAILLAAGAFVKVRIPPAYAGLGELVSVLPVIAIAMQLRWIKFHQK